MVPEMCGMFRGALWLVWAAGSEPAATVEVTGSRAVKKGNPSLHPTRSIADN